ncbi:MAG: hypothetical protein ACTSYB_02120 [Candidatus Helarchaeota archaeon]
MVGDDNVEALDDAMIEDMGKGYRFRPMMQAVLIGIIILVTAFTLFLTDMLDFTVVGHLTITTLTFCWILAFVFPLIVKTKSHRVHQISMGIYWASILSLIGSIILLIVDQSQTTTILPTSIALLIAFLVGVGSQLFQHLNPELVKRNALTYLSVFSCSVVFFICVWIYMETLIPGWGIWLTIVFTALFAYALLPEKTI